MNKFPVSLLQQLLGSLQDGLSIRVTAQKVGFEMRVLFPDLLTRAK